MVYLKNLLRANLAIIFQTSVLFPEFHGILMQFNPNHDLHNLMIPMIMVWPGQLPINI